MPKNYFKENRLGVQKSFFDSAYLTPITMDSLPIRIEERNNKNRAADTLKFINIYNIPVQETGIASYLLDAEIKNQIFSNPQDFKTVEGAVIVLTKRVLHVTLIEMKSTLIRDEIARIETKINHSISKILLFLTYYIFDNDFFDGCEIKFSIVIFYNTDRLTKDINPPIETPLLNHDLVKIFKGEKNHYYIKDKLGQEFRVDVLFQENTGDLQQFDFDYKRLFKDEATFNDTFKDLVTLP